MDNKSVQVKVCGITNLEDALAAVNAGADALGFVFYPESPRYIRPMDAAEIVAKLPPFVSTVGVFVNSPRQKVEETVGVSGLSVVQFHGDEGPAFCKIFPRVIKAMRVQGSEVLDELQDYPTVGAFLLDAYDTVSRGGTGQTFDWDIAAHAATRHRVIIAGGLTPENVTEAVNHVRPYAVDVSSGVESSPGRKDHAKMKFFVKFAKGASWSGA